MNRYHDHIQKIQGFPHHRFRASGIIWGPIRGFLGVVAFLDSPGPSDYLHSGILCHQEVRPRGRKTYADLEG